MKLKLLFCSIIFLFIVGMYAFARDIPVSVKFNNEYINFSSKPILLNGTTYLPVRLFCEIFSADVVWDEANKQVTVLHNGNIFTFKINESTAIVNGIETEIRGNAKIFDDRSYLPLRFLAENMGAEVDWEENYFTVILTCDQITLPDEIILKRAYSDDEIYWLAKIISAESETQSMDGKIAVGNVVLNRVKHENYPNTIYSVIFDKKFGVQFQPVANGTIYKEPSRDSYLAAKLCLEGENVVGECLYFLNPEKSQSLWIPENRDYFTTIGEHDFYI